MRPLRLSLVVTLALACGSSNPSNPGPKDPPQVFLLIPNSNVVGTELDLQVTVEGCDKVSSATVQSDDGSVTKGFAYSAASGTAVPVAIATADVAHWHSIAAHLNLTASATCDDGRTNTSQAQAATFFPVAQVVSHADQSYVVPTLFYAEGSGGSTHFVGCGKNANGTNALVKVDVSGNILANQTLPNAMDCTILSWFSDPVTVGPTTYRWFVTPWSSTEPHSGAVAFDTSTLAFTGAALDASGSPLPVTALGVGPDGDAVVFTYNPTLQNWIYKIGHTNLSLAPGSQGPLWSKGSSDPRVPQGNPLVDSGGNFWMPVREDTSASPSSSSNFEVEERSYADGSLINGAVTPGGIPTLLGPETWTDTAPSIAMVVSADASLTFLPFNTFNSNGTATGNFAVEACGTTGNCSTTNQFNNSPAEALPGFGLAAIPFGPGFPYLAAVGAQHTYLLDNRAGTRGQLLNQINPTGALLTNNIQVGHGQDFYILNGTSVPGLPLEIVASDSPANGELFRYGIASDSVSMAIDDSGQPWLRISNKLVQPLTNAQYRAMLSQ